MKDILIRKLMRDLGSRAVLSDTDGVPSNLLGKSITLRGYFIDHDAPVKGVVRKVNNIALRVEVPELNGITIVVPKKAVSTGENGLEATSTATGKATVMSGTKVIAAEDEQDSDTSSDDDTSDAVSMGTKDGANKEGKLSVFITKEDHTFADKLYSKYVSETDFSHKAQFIMDLDKLVLQFRGGAPITDTDVDDFLSEDGSGVDNTDNSDTANPEPSANTNDEDNSDNSLDENTDDSGDEDDDPSKNKEVAGILEEHGSNRIYDKLNSDSKRVYSYLLKGNR